MISGGVLRHQIRAQQHAALRSFSAQWAVGRGEQTRRLASSQAARKATRPPVQTQTPKANATPAASSSTASSSTSKPLEPASPSAKPYEAPTPTGPGKIGSNRKQTWLTTYLLKSPRAMKVFLGFTRALGYASPKQVAGQRTFVIYEHICAVRPDEDKDFWQNGLYLPPTFQSWFTITSLHVWLLIVRFRALPAEHGKHYHQGIVDHFFMDIEDRIRDILQPPSRPLEPYTFHTDFYANPNAPVPAPSGEGEKKQKRVRVPDRIVTQQMKIFNEQWQGMSMNFDLGMVKGDEELAASIWRNLLGARGAQGIDYSPASSDRAFRRAVNLVGGEVVDVRKVDFEAEQTKDDGSGVHDFPPNEVDKYLEYPDRMLDIVRYIRRELKRLEAVSDDEIIRGNWRELKFGDVHQKEKL